MDISIIPTIQRSKKPAKPRYIKPDSVKRLEADYYEWKYRNSTIPPQCRVKPHFRDDTANGLAKCIEITPSINARIAKDNMIHDWAAGGSQERRPALPMYR